MEHFHVPAGLEGIHSRVEALESAGRVASNWEELVREEIKKAIAGNNTRDGILKGILESKAIGESIRWMM